MKHLISLLAILLLPAALLAQTTYVLSTGVSNYGNPETNLHNTTKDAKAFADLYRKRPNPKVSVVTSAKATKSNILKHLYAIKTLAKPGDTVIFFFSGHGMVDSFIAYDVQFYYKDLIDVLRQMKTHKVFVFIDASLSGSVQSAVSDFQWSGSNGETIAFMMSSRANEYSIENRWLNNGFFTQALLLALRGKGDTDGNKQVTLLEAFKYVHKDVTTRESRQHPQLIASKSLYDEVLITW